MNHETPQSGDRAQRGRVYARNRRAHHDYKLLDKYDCGIQLQGWEVKSIRAGRVDLSGSYVHFRNAEAWLIGMQITPLATSSQSSTTVEPDRSRKLLIKKNEINKLIKAVRSSHYTCVPLDVHQGSSSYLKVQVALAQGAKKSDQRQRVKQRDWQRQKAKLLKRQTTDSSS